MLGHPFNLSWIISKQYANIIVIFSILFWMMVCVFLKLAVMEF